MSKRKPKTYRDYVKEQERMNREQNYQLHKIRQNLVGLVQTSEEAIRTLISFDEGLGLFETNEDIDNYIAAYDSKAKTLIKKQTEVENDR